VIRREQSADVLRIEPLRLRREADEIDEDDRDDFAFLAEPALLSLERTRAALQKRAPSGFCRPQLGQVTTVKA
jgi:hypothetical protein